MRLRSLGGEDRRRLRLLPGGGHVGDVEESEGEVDPSQGELGVRGQRLLELLRRVREAELLHERHPEVVRAVGGLAGVGDGRGDGKEKEEAKGSRRREGHPSILSGPAFQLKAGPGPRPSQGGGVPVGRQLPRPVPHSKRAFALFGRP